MNQGLNDELFRWERHVPEGTPTVLVEPDAGSDEDR